MKRDVFENIQQKLVPDDAVVESLLEKARTPSPARETTIQKGEITMKATPTAELKSRLPAMISAAAVLAAAVGLGAFAVLHQSSEKLPTSPAEEQFVVSTPQPDPVPDVTTVTQPDTFTDTTPAETSPDPTEQQPDVTTATAVIDEPLPEETVTAPADDDALPLDWTPDPADQDYGGESYDGKASARAIPADEYRSFVLDGRRYTYASSTKGEVYSEFYGETDSDDLVNWNYNMPANIPNDSYIGDYLDTVSIASSLTDIRPDAQAEVYSLQYTDFVYLLAVKFTSVDDGGRYYLYADTSLRYDSFSMFIAMTDLRICSLGGDSLIRRSTYHTSAEDCAFVPDAPLTDLICSIDGEICDAPTGDLEWETFPDTRIYGGSLSFRWYPDGYVTVCAFGSEMTYSIGSESAAKVIDYLDSTGRPIR